MAGIISELPIRNIFSFNPSFTGIALVAPTFQHPARICSASFNPSFTGIALVAFSTSSLSCLLHLVSILLLLELPWWHDEVIFVVKKHLGFNPSFTGIALVA